MTNQAIDLVELPLFPLNMVLFPGQVLPLHIYEDRYQLMIRRCLAEDSAFGIVLAQRSLDGGSGIETHEIGTVTRIVESSHLADGTMNIVTVGVERFRIHRLLRDQPYLRGEVETLPMPLADDAEPLGRLSTQVQAGVQRYIELIAEAAGLRIQVGDIPDTPSQVGYLAAVAMQIDNREKQALLDDTSLGSVLATEVGLLSRENALLTWMTQSNDWPESAQFGPSGTLLPN
jgi:Lon protease-like protein